MKPTVGSLFAGIGGFDLGFERAGFKTVWQVEINEWCRRVLARHFPEAERYSDVRECGSHNLEPVDVICGGFPCQDISNAGLRAGIEGERSGLWGEFARIIGELRPQFVLVENVAALLGRGMGRVLGDLASIGYDAEWEVVSAADVGAPHLRKRVWILAYASDGQWPLSAVSIRRSATALLPSRHGFSWPLADSSGRRLSEPQGWEMEQPRRTEAVSCRDALANADRNHEQRRGSDVQVGRLGLESEAQSDGEPARAQWSVEPDVGRVAHGVPARVDRLRGLGNAVVPQIPELYARRLYSLLQERAA